MVGIHYGMKEHERNKVDYHLELKPENGLELALLEDPEFLEGLDWGLPRYGHPEGEVYRHIAEVLGNIDKIKLDPEARRILRVIAYAHDTFKHIEHKGKPRDWSRHHSVLAAQYLAKHTDNKTILDITELHDEAYYSWRMEYLYHQHEEGQARLQKLLHRIGDNIQLYYLFFKCDTRTGDKTQAPVKWFEQTIKNIEIVEF
ncbi:hypothetical protein [Haliscomenobacter hydrossis]|uniref:HD domain-containing protein n=1 Tax=Haliscomenobacter hydrossis (strain ATCC 27775 / DSM 1100 / LMG 10767 / O) TaxID=760192 RepID=F4L4D8_HALH1|nr:hypothetical protein [Haliscomenobacter hydrossis]AEE51807.1 hypothetical protein Halhy_3959 [Haliscomenobacter hydrossis DSM 1100]